MKGVDIFKSGEREKRNNDFLTTRNKTEELGDLLRAKSQEKIQPKKVNSLLNSMNNIGAKLTSQSSHQQISIPALIQIDKPKIIKRRASNLEGVGPMEAVGLVRKASQSNISLLGNSVKLG